MGASQWSQQWQVVHHIDDAYDRKPGMGFPNVADLGRAAGLSAPAARRLIDRCVREQLA
jgi:hypothetical protein